MIKRVVFDVLLFLSIFLFPWWMTALLSILGVFVFKQFYEFIAVGIIVHSLYIVSGNGLLSSPLWFTVIIFGLYVVTQYIRRYIILYKNEIPY